MHSLKYKSNSRLWYQNIRGVNHPTISSYRRTLLVFIYFWPSVIEKYIFFVLYKEIWFHNNWLRKVHKTPEHVLTGLLLFFRGSSYTYHHCLTRFFVNNIIMILNIYIYFFILLSIVLFLLYILFINIYQTLSEYYYVYDTMIIKTQFTEGRILPSVQI